MPASPATTVALDPEWAVAFEAFPAFFVNAESLSVMRATSLAAVPELSDKVERTDFVVPAEGAHPDIVVRLHRPVGATDTLPCVYSMHGGGYVLGSYAMDDARFDKWCVAFNCAGVSVEYRLAPETPYPGPLEDCYRGLKWAYENHQKLGIDRTRIGIAGVSAGGGLCAALALLARDRGEMPLAFQLLECPMVDDRQTTPSSRLEGLAIWSRESNSFGWKSYLGSLYGTDDIPGYAVPARASDLSGLPPAYVCVGAADGFRDEDITYAMRLNQAGVPTELHVYPGAPHGVSIFAHTAVARQYISDVELWMSRQLAK